MVSRPAHIEYSLFEIEHAGFCLLTVLQYQFIGIGELQGIPVVENGPISCNGAARYVYVDCSARVDAKLRAPTLVEQARIHTRVLMNVREPSAWSGDAIAFCRRPRFLAPRTASPRNSAQCLGLGWIQICRKCTGSLPDGLSSAVAIRWYRRSSAGHHQAESSSRYAHGVFVCELLQQAHIADDLHVAMNVCRNPSPPVRGR